MAIIDAFNEPGFVVLCAFIYGLAFGSFLNVCIYRLPRELSVVSPASACPQCGAGIKFYDNVPVISWMVLRGKCRACGCRISVRYLVVELITGILFGLSFWLFGLSFAAVKLSVFSFLLVGLIFTDADVKLLPDRLTLPGLASGLAFSLFVPVEGFWEALLRSTAMPVSPDAVWRVVSLLESASGAVLGAGFIWLAGEAYKRVRGVEGMGFGDVKLMAMVGAFLGIKLTLLTLMLGSLSGALAGSLALLVVFRKRLHRRRAAGEAAPGTRDRAWASAQLVMRHFEMPFGVFLGTGALVAAFFGQPLVRWYVGLY